MYLFFSPPSYHKIGGDVCTGGDEDSYVAIEKPCCYSGSSSSSSSGGSSTTSIVLGCFILVALLVIGVFAGIFIVFIM